MTSDEALYKLYLIAESTTKNDDELIELNKLVAIIIDDLKELEELKKGGKQCELN